MNRPEVKVNICFKLFTRLPFIHFLCDSAAGDGAGTTHLPGEVHSQRGECPPPPSLKRLLSQTHLVCFPVKKRNTSLILGVKLEKRRRKPSCMKMMLNCSCVISYETFSCSLWLQGSVCTFTSSNVITAWAQWFKHLLLLLLLDRGDVFSSVIKSAERLKINQKRNEQIAHRTNLSVQSITCSLLSIEAQILVLKTTHVKYK